MSTNLDGIFMKERERERGAESITYLFSKRKFYVHRNWYVVLQDFAAFPFSALCVRGKRVVTTDNIVYLRFIERYDTNYGV